jgi:hypothetical protein
MGRMTGVASGAAAWPARLTLCRMERGSARVWTQIDRWSFDFNFALFLISGCSKLGIRKLFSFVL